MCLYLGPRKWYGLEGLGLAAESCFLEQLPQIIYIESFTPQREVSV